MKINGIRLPKNPKDPTGQAGREAKAVRDFSRRYAGISKDLSALVSSLPVTVTTNADYQYDISSYSLQMTLESIEQIIDKWLAQGRGRWWWDGYTTPAYKNGVASTRNYLASQSAIYAATRPELEAIFLAPEYQRRVLLLREAGWTDIKGLSDDLAKDAKTILTESMLAGESPRKTMSLIRDRIGVSKSRSNNIVRTAIPGAYRQATRDETRTAEAEYNIKTKMMHLASLLPRMRIWHFQRHGKLYTVDEVEQWYSVDGNRYRCRCHQSPIIVDDNGEPLYPRAQQAALKQKEKAVEMGLGKPGKE